MTKIITAIDGSDYINSVCEAAAWANLKINKNIALLHIINHRIKNIADDDLSGSIGVDSRRNILDKLTKIDEERGKIEIKKGKIILEHGFEQLTQKNIKNVETIHRHGSLVEIISDLDNETAMIIMGKRGEDSNLAPDHLGSNLERVARSTHKPILLVENKFCDIKNFAFAYDNSETCNKLLDFISQSDLLKGLDCHLIKVAENSKLDDLAQAKQKLEDSGFQVYDKILSGSNVALSVKNYLQNNNIDLLTIGAYSHFKIHNLILGSTTTSFIKEINKPLLLLR